MLKKPLCIAFLWHMHQPDYRNTQTGETYLPWTRFHAIKDYYDMASLVERAGNVHIMFNLVPSLVEQLESYGSGRIQEVYTSLTRRDASTLNADEKAFLLRTFFQLSPARMLLPYPRYRELYERRGPASEQGEYSSVIGLYTAQDYRDLQVWYNLTWCGHELRKDPEIKRLFAKARGFSEEDKQRLLDIQYAFIGRILPYYRRLSESASFEFSISPYYHPILPLLCDMRVAKEALPDIPLPSDLFRYPQDAREHIKLGIAEFTRIFGRSAQGMWPSEGALSDAALALAKEAGLRWLASDESVLWNSLHREGRVGGTLSPERKYSAYRWGESASGPCLFFRDHALSDLFGFSYYHWNEKEAVADFCRRLRGIHHSLPDDGRHYIVPIILDGENAWEHYPENGTPFLETLYRELGNAADLRTVTFSEFLALEPQREPLRSVLSGSWIYGNLATWAGHEEKNRAWELIAAARRFWGACQQRDPNAQGLQDAFREMMIAEGSDWFWWFGDDHPTENAAEFDALFRSRLKNVYQILGEKPPQYLDKPIKKTKPKIQYRNPVQTLTPQIDGVESDYYEWISAGYAVPGGGASMHRTDRFLQKLYFAYDLKFFYLRIDLVQEKIAAFPRKGAIQVQFVSPGECGVMLEYAGEKTWRCKPVAWQIPGKIPEFAASKVLELGLPLEALRVEKPSEVSFFVSVLENERETERFPETGVITVPTDPWGLDHQEWMV